MQRKLVVEFTKMNGAGNDFIILDNRFYFFSADELSALAKQYCPRRTGIGADGLLALQSAEDPQFDYRMTYYNADGSLGTMCGNGARCLAQFAQWAGIRADTYAFESDAGAYRAQVLEHGRVRLFVQPPQRMRVEVLPSTVLDKNINACHFIWTGTEHVVCEIATSLKNLAVEKEGPILRYHEAFAPTGANVNFIERINGQTLQVRTFEKGVEAETLACGTGAIASAVMATMRGLVDKVPVTVEMVGGTLLVGFEQDTFTDVWLEGPTETIYRGTIEV